MKEGVPQGAVLSPLLFITFLDDLLQQFEEGTLVSAYADDLALAVGGSRKEDLEERMQREEDKVVEWSSRSGLTLNTGKCEACLFTPSTAEYKWSPTLTITGQHIKDTQNLRFQGILYDKMLTFNRHVEEGTQKMRERMCLLHKVGGADWGWSRESMRTVYAATQRSVAEYGSAAWAPWMSQSSLDKIERASRRAARRVTGATQSTPGEAVAREAGLEEMKTRYRRAAVGQYERWKHLEEGDPRRETADREVPRRTQKRDWRESSREVYEGIMRGLPEVEEVQTVHPPPPWKTGVSGGVILTGASN